MNNDILSVAAKYIGMPYVWGGESVREGGFDCSGYVYNVLRDCDITKSRDTAQGYFNRFKKNRIYNKEAGALLFFGKSINEITHVAICKNESQMYESIGGKKNTINNKGKGVTLSKISRRKDLVAICRVVTNSDYYPAYTGVSVRIDEIFRTIGAPNGCVSKRRPVAAANGYLSYSGTLSENIALIKLAKAGKLRRV